MNYLEEYTEQLISLKQGNKVKIDVHFIISEPLTSFCYNVNKQIRKHNVGFINMGVESIVVPHISLYMGYVDSYEMMERLFTAVEDYTKNLKPFMLDATNMYFKGVSRNAPQYLFIDSLQNDFLMQQKTNLDEHLKDVVHPNDWNMKDERAHVTVGCYKNISSTVHDIVRSCNSIPSCKISQIGVSITGKRGVCLSLLKVFDLER